MSTSRSIEGWVDMARASLACSEVESWSEEIWKAARWIPWDERMAWVQDVPRRGDTLELGLASHLLVSMELEGSVIGDHASTAVLTTQLAATFERAWDVIDDPEGINQWSLERVGSALWVMGLRAPDVLAKALNDSAPTARRRAIVAVTVLETYTLPALRLVWLEQARAERREWESDVDTTVPLVAEALGLPWYSSWKSLSESNLGALSTSAAMIVMQYDNDELVPQPAGVDPVNWMRVR